MNVLTHWRETVHGGCFLFLPDGTLQGLGMCSDFTNDRHGKLMPSKKLLVKEGPAEEKQNETKVIS